MSQDWEVLWGTTDRIEQMIELIQTQLPDVNVSDILSTSNLEVAKERQIALGANPTWMMTQDFIIACVLNCDTFSEAKRCYTIFTNHGFPNACWFDQALFDYGMGKYCQNEDIRIRYKESIARYLPHLSRDTIEALAWGIAPYVIPMCDFTIKQAGGFKKMTDLENEPDWLDKLRQAGFDVVKQIMLWVIL